jgi:CRISPR-associated protein Csb2
MVGDQLPALLSGHGLPSGNRHEHAFYLPEDADGDGRIDHVIIHVPAGLDAACCAVLDTLRLVRGRDGQEWHVLLEWLEDNRRVSGSSALLAQGQQFISVTPYLHPWYAKKRFGVAEQIRRECRLRRLPLPEVALLDTLPVLQRRLRPVHFRRIRSRKGMTQPDTRGCFCRLVFPEPVRGPLALGFGCHFGMGLFSTEAHDTG